MAARAGLEGLRTLTRPGVATGLKHNLVPASSALVSPLRRPPTNSAEHVVATLDKYVLKQMIFIFILVLINLI